ncbi:FAD-dependent thymidylate synthase [Rhizobium sp.]|uniref:FAD-dependent thymidylate synthase n=1 Tax=Rhizobium sp. TaxID=391 RepID=UPI00289912B2
MTDERNDLADKRPTSRPVSAGIDNLLFRELPVLDHGFVRVIDYMGDDNAVVQAARVSYGRGTKSVRDDASLIRYLMRNEHTSPFEMAEIKLHIKLPIFVARQWIRHRTANVSEISGRYSILDNEFYLPSPETLGTQSATNRQGREHTLDEEQSADVLDFMKGEAERAYATYTHLLGSESAESSGLARELARMNLTLNYYTQLYWKIDLHNFMKFISLRINPRSQFEIRAYAEKLAHVLAEWTPISYEAFLEYRQNGFTLSAKALLVVRRLLDGHHVDFLDSGLTKREWDELMLALGRR